MLTLSQDGWSLPLGDTEQVSAWNPRTETGQPLSASERKQLAAHTGGYWMVLTRLLIASGIAGSLLLPLGFGPETAFVAACLVFMCSLNFPIAENPGRDVRDDIELGTKVLISGRVAATRMAGSSCILNLVSDKAPERTIEFELPRSAFAGLQQAESASVWYVPASEIVMELSTASYRYRLGD